MWVLLLLIFKEAGKVVAYVYLFIHNLNRGGTVQPAGFSRLGGGIVH